MAYRFLREKDYTDRLYIVSRKGPIPIIAYSRIEITISSLIGDKKITLINIYYIPKFITNLVSESYLEDKGKIFRDSKRRRI